MATWYSNELGGTSGATIDSLPVVKPSAPNAYNARLKRFRATITLAAQASGDIIHLARVPAGSVFAFGLLNSSVSLGTATIAIGISGTTGKYLAAQTYTSVSTPGIFAAPYTDESMSPYTAEEAIYLTIATAALPASGTLVVDLFFSHPN